MFAVMGSPARRQRDRTTLLQRGQKVRAIVRDEAKAQAWKNAGVEIVTANYDENFIAAFTGVEGVFAMISPNMAPEPCFPDSVARIAAIKKAILLAKPPRAVFLSCISSEKPPDSVLSPPRTSSSKN